MVKTILLRGGTTAEHENFSGHDREVTIDTDTNELVLHLDGVAYRQAKLVSVPTQLSQLTEDSGLWTKSALTKVSQLTDDVGYWANLTSVSQLENDLNWKTGHCTYCTHCTYCSQCSRCNNTQCYQVHCYQVHCSQCSGYCTSLCSLCTTACHNCNCSGNCTDDNM